MNVYDFDGTIYRGDSTLDFYRFVLKKQPRHLRHLPRQLWGTVLYAAGRLDKTRWKEEFYSFLQGLDTRKLAEAFWDEAQGKMEPWYLAQQHPDDLVISASPEFLLVPICQRVGICRLLASQVDPFTGKYQGKNCRGEEKAARFHDAWPQGKIEKFYSDSLSDQPLADLAQEAYLVKNGEVRPWKA